MLKNGQISTELWPILQWKLFQAQLNRHWNLTSIVKYATALQ